MARVVMLLGNNTYPQDVRVRSEAQSLTKADYRVTVLAERGMGQPRRERIGGVNVRRYSLPRTSASRLGYALEYAVINAKLYASGAWLLLRGAEVIHLHNPPDTLFGVGWLARALRRRVVFDHHDLAPEMLAAKFGKSALTRVFRLFERSSLRCANLVIAANDSHRDIAMARGGVPAERIAVVRNGPPGEALAAATEPRDGALIGPRLLFLGSMERQDGVDDLVAAFEEIVRRRGFPDARLTFVGKGSHKDSLESAFAAAGLDQQVRFTGFVPYAEVATYLADADICLDPAPCTELNDGSTMVKIAEYMAARRAVVCFPLRETRRTAGDAVAFAECGDLASFVDEVCALARDPERRLKLAQQAYERAGELTWDASEVNLLAAYARLLGTASEALT